MTQGNVLDIVDNSEWSNGRLWVGLLDERTIYGSSVASGVDTRIRPPWISVRGSESILLSNPCDSY